MVCWHGFSSENTQALDNAYQQKTLRFGWGQDWSYGISSRFTFSYANRVYREKRFDWDTAKIVNTQPQLLYGIEIYILWD